MTSSSLRKSLSALAALKLLLLHLVGRRLTQRSDQLATEF